MIKQLPIRITTSYEEVMRNKLSIYGMYSLDDLIKACNTIAKLKGKEEFHKFIGIFSKEEVTYTSVFRIKEETMNEIQATINEFGIRKGKVKFYAYLGYIFVNSRNPISEAKILLEKEGKMI